MAFRSARLTLCGLVLMGSFTASPAWGLNGISIPEVVLAEGSSGAALAVHASHDSALSGFSLSIRYQPAAITITGVTSAGTSIEAPEYWKGVIDKSRGEVIWGAVLDLTAPLDRALAASVDQVLALLLVDVAAKAGTKSAVELIDGLGSYPTPNMLIDMSGNPVGSLALRSGSITVGPPGYLPPLADAGSDLAVAELATVLLDGSKSSSPSALPLAYRWSQLSGPLAEPAGPMTAARATLAMPAVSGDQTLVFELQVDDGVSQATDQVTVTAVDLDLRKAALQPVAGGTVPAGPGGLRALVFQADLQWGATVEGGLWKGARFWGAGSGDESKLLAGAALYVDANGNHIFDAGDRQLASSPPPAADNGLLAFQFSEPLSAGTSLRFFLVVDLAAGAPAGPSGEVRFDLLSAGDLSLLGAETGVSIPVQGLPLHGPPLGKAPVFLRGDANQDLKVDLSDGITLLSYLFLGGTVTCLEAADSNDDSQVKLDDAITIFSFLFQGQMIPPPSGAPGVDPTPDGLGCAR
jgi:hypothetical protein